MDAAYITIEAQKSTGSLHAHGQCFVQCLHQHTPLQEIFSMAEERLATLRAEYLEYVSHVSHSVYKGQTPEEMEAGVAAAEAAWPEYQLDTVMTSFPAYQSARARPDVNIDQQEKEAKDWATTYLCDDVVKLQYLKQHHYHKYHPETGERVPLRGCQRADKPGECKSDYPRTAWVSDEASVLCPCELERKGMAQQGHKNRMCSLCGPYGHEYLNGCHPALLAGIRGGNVDVQVPYRLPYACRTCGQKLSAAQRRAVAGAVQRAQDAQTGYCSDYCAKNQPMAFHEIREFQKGHCKLHAEILQRGDSLENVGKKHAMRIMSDAYCKGIVRGQVECCNLRANHVEETAVAAERVTTAVMQDFPGHAFVNAVRRQTDKEDAVPQATAWRKQRQQLRRFDWAQAYGHRPCHDGLWELSPYEFIMYWDVVPMRVPGSRKEWMQEPAEQWDVTMTAAGRAKIEKAKGEETKLTLTPGKDYKVKQSTKKGRVQYPAQSGAVLRHGWCLQRRSTPHVPCFAHCPVPARLDEKVNENARLTMAYFRAWTFDARRCTDSVVHVTALRGLNESWEKALREWLLKLPCQETKDYLGNFMSVYRVRPAVEGLENSDDEEADAALHLQQGDLDKALRTKLSSHGKISTPERKGAADELVAAALQKANEVWATENTQAAQAEKTPNTWAEVPAEEAIKAAKKKRSKCEQSTTKREDASPTVAIATSWQQEHKIDEWVQSLDASKCNPEQKEFCKRIAGRVQTELRQDGSEEAAEMSEPLRWALHGGPGTGKSYTLNLVRKELFERILGWEQGVHFQVVTLQAVMAEQLDGDTIHHALSSSNGISEAKMLQLCATTLQWRWLFIDEISMVSAELLARLELRCRELVRDVSKYKYGRDGLETRCFGGLNVCFSGDLWQLPPPRGTFIGEVPWEMITKASNKKLALTIRGQELVWGQVQGVTELVQCERTRDEWLQEVQDQLRHGRLSDENHAFLHGRLTQTPGSACKGVVTCQQPECQRLMDKQHSALDVSKQECSTCKIERKSKALVLQGENDKKDVFHSDAILPTNAVKYHVNKLRAQEWAKQHGERIRYAICNDRISSAALREKPDLGQEKLEWLQKHDQECGGLYGILPICMGMPVRATDHIDRERSILRGCRGVVVGWSPETWSESYKHGDEIIWNTLPGAVYVRFETAAKWTVAGLREANVYPVAPQRKQWHLDKHRKRPMLRVTRKQYPLAPAFAITAHAAQGQTAKEKVVADLHIGDSGDPLTAYVAVTRVTGRRNLAVLRPFAAKPYQQGTRLGRGLLLQVWRGDEIDWEVLRAQYLEEKPCAECGVRKRKNEYTAGQWKRDENKRICKECVARHVEDGVPWQCSVCSCWRGPAEFPAKHQRAQCAFYRVCVTCKEQKKCDLCERLLEEKMFSQAQWKRKQSGQRVCTECQKRGQWTCYVCKTRRLQAHFSRWGKNRRCRQDGRQKCNICINMTHAGQRTHARLQRRRRKVAAEEKVAKVLQEVRAEIQQGKAKKRARVDTSPKGAKRHEATEEESKQRHEQGLGLQKGEATERNEYECPYCQAKTYSSVRTGNVQVAGHCGKQFRVRSCVVARSFTHSCPRCGMEVQSAKASGRIQSKHKTPNGKTCPKTEWVVK